MGREIYLYGTEEEREKARGFQWYWCLSKNVNINVHHYVMIRASCYDVTYHWDLKFGSHHGPRIHLKICYGPPPPQSLSLRAATLYPVSSLKNASRITTVGHRRAAPTPKNESWAATIADKIFLKKNI